MAAEGRFQRQFPDVIRIQGMAHVILCWSVAAPQIVWVLRKYPTAVRKTDQSPIRNFIEGVPVGIVHLNHAMAPGREPSLERSYHAVIVGHRIGVVLCYPAESRVRTR